MIETTTVITELALIDQCYRSEQKTLPPLFSVNFIQRPVNFHKPEKCGMSSAMTPGDQSRILIQGLNSQ